ncbi:Regulatory protein [Yarrowia sp. C11]|nr:Regulatory protein [Yarrowia sp. E02]KAG5369181.1 Regulatory protein [Yarrowia sp. C11]
MTDRLFLANLNAIEDPQHTEPSPDNDDLSIFTNTQFFDFDMGCSTDIAASVDDMIVEQEKYLQKIQQQQAHQQQQQQAQQQHSQAFQPQPPSSSRSQYDSLKNPGGEANNLHMDFDFNEFSILEQQQQQPQPQPQQQRPILQPVSQKPAGYQAVTSPQSTMTSTGVGTASMPPPTAGPTQEEIQAAILANSQQVKKRKQSSVDVSVASTPAKSPEDSYEGGDCSIRAAEDDKRRRNTAASARFRIKKKMREQEMEKQAKDLQDKVSSLEAKILSLEMENKWLKNLVVEKNDARGADELQNLKDSVLRETTPIAKIEQV